MGNSSESVRHVLRAVVGDAAVELCRASYSEDIWRLLNNACQLFRLAHLLFLPPYEQVSVALKDGRQAFGDPRTRMVAVSGGSHVGAW